MKWKTLDKDQKYTIIDKFLDDYNLTIEEAAEALGTSVTTFKDIQNKNKNKSDDNILKTRLDFLENFIKLSGYKETKESLFSYQNQYDITPTSPTPQLCNNLNQLTDTYLQIFNLLKDRKGITEKKTQLFSYLHKPTICLLGDSFSDKNNIISEIFPETKEILKSFPVLIIHQNVLPMNIYKAPELSHKAEGNNLDECFLSAYNFISSQTPDMNLISQISIHICNTEQTSVESVILFFDKIRKIISNDIKLDWNFEKHYKTEILINIKFKDIDLTNPFILTPTHDSPAEPYMLIDKFYYDNCTVSYYNEINLKTNSTIIIPTSVSFLENCNILNIPDIQYEPTTNKKLRKITQDSIENIFKLLTFADIVLYFEASSRFLTLSETPLINFLLNKNFRLLKFIMTKKDLIKFNKKEMTFSQPSAYKVLHEKELSNTPQSSSICSYTPPENITLDEFQKSILFYSGQIDFIIETINKLVEDFMHYADTSFIQPMLSYSNEMKFQTLSMDNQIATPSREIKNTLSQSFKQIQNKEYLKEIISTIHKKDKYTKQDLIKLPEQISEVIIRDQKNKIETADGNNIKLIYELDTLKAEYTLFLGNLFYEFFEDNKNYLKSDTSTWANKIYKILTDENIGNFQKNIQEILNIKIGIYHG